MARPETLSTPPAWLVWIVQLLIPPNARQGKKFLLEDLWRKHPAVRKVIPELVPALADTIYAHAYSAFYGRMAAVQACILLMVYIDVLTARMFAVLVIAFGILIVHEAYVRPSERLQCELITTLWVPPLIIVLSLLVGLIPPHTILPLDQLLPRTLVKLAIPIALARFLFARDLDPNHPFKDLLALHYRVWFFNYLWMALGLTYLLTLDQAAPAKWFIEPFLTVSPAIKLFVTSFRLQLNPIGAKYRHSMVVLTLLTDPYEDEIRMKRDYLLTGSDWFGKFELQSLLEMLAFLFALAPLAIGVWQWYVGDPNAARINWIQMAMNGAAWVVVISTWPYIKRMNREVAVPFDKKLRALRRERWAA